MVRSLSTLFISLTYIVVLFSPGEISAQQRYRYTMTLEEVIETAREQSPSALVAKHNFIANYWQFRSFKAQFLPSVSLGAVLASYDRSLRALQNSQTGEINYIVNNNMNNSLNLSVSQNIPLTGGKVSLTTSLNRLDQFSPNNTYTYNSNPVYLSYTQPLKAYNTLKWEKITEPKKFEKAKREYLESLEEINISAVNLFFSVLSAQSSLEIAKKRHASTELSLKMAQQRFEIGTISNNDLLQLRLGLYNSSLEIGDKEAALNISMLRLLSFLGFNENVEITLIVPEEIPEVQLEFSDVYSKAIEYSSDMLKNELSILTAEQAVAQAKSSNGIQAGISAQFGLTQKGGDLQSAYRNPMDQERIGVTLTLPILDWGLGKGRVKLAQSREDVVRTQVDQSISQYRQDLLIKVLEFNKLNDKYNISLAADSIAKLRYDMAIEAFNNGNLDILRLNSAQADFDNSAARYISEIGNFWKSYYTIRKLSLYDYLRGREVTADFDKMIN
jgi:outer membrane protein